MKSIAILGGGNIGVSIAKGLKASGLVEAGNIQITRRNLEALKGLQSDGFQIHSDNGKAVQDCDVLVIAVRPLQFPSLFQEIKPYLKSTHRILSVASGVSIEEIQNLSSADCQVVRVMPNTAIAVRESMTCLSANSDSREALAQAVEIFNTVGKTVVIEEEQFNPATALCACGTAFFLRSIRAASQGGIQIGFHSDEALMMAAQTAKGAASLLIDAGSHPEEEIDKVTTPRGCTIAGLNHMEHKGFSSALIQGIVTSSEIAGKLYCDDEE